MDEVEGKNTKRNRRRLLIAGVLAALILVLPFGVSAYMAGVTEQYVVAEVTGPIEGGRVALDKETLGRIKSLEADCIMVLGAGLRADGTPNSMLQDRLDLGIALYKAGAAPKLLLTGDNGQEEYDEVNAMKACALAAGVPPEDIFLDHAGFSTYDSMYRAKDIFKVDKAIVVTQKYHQHRAIYMGRGFGIEAYGAASDQRTYVGQGGRELREIAARDKDFLKMLIKPEPKYLGEAIPISGKGLASHD